MARPSKHSSLACLTKKRLITRARDLQLDLAQAESVEAFVHAIASAPSSDFATLLDALSLAELKKVCSEHALPKTGAKPDLLAWILDDDSAQPSLIAPSSDAPPPAATSSPTTATVLDALSRERLFDLGRVFGAGLRDARQPKSAVVKHLAEHLGEGRMLEILPELGRDELRTVCRLHGLAQAESLQRDALIEALARAVGIDVRPEPQPLMSHDRVPRTGQVLAARGRQWLIEAVVSGEHKESPLLRLACLDDDSPGRKLEILWDLELGAVDSDTTSTIRDLAPKFDNRLFLSATPHNGHSNSVSALLEILDPIRFTRGVPVPVRSAEVPPYCPTTPAERDAHKAFEDEIVDRLYVLNAERAREEQRLGLGKKSKTRAKKPKKAKDDGGQTSLL